MRAGPDPISLYSVFQPPERWFLPVTKSHSSHRFCSWKATCSYFQHRGKKSKDRKTPSKSGLVNKYPPWNGGKLHHDPQPHSLANETHEGKARACRPGCKTSRRVFAGAVGIVLTWPQRNIRYILSVATGAGNRVPHPWTACRQYLPGCLWIWWGNGGGDLLYCFLGKSCSNYLPTI